MHVHQNAHNEAPAYMQAVLTPVPDNMHYYKSAKLQWKCTANKAATIVHFQLPPKSLMRGVTKLSMQCTCLYTGSLYDSI